MTSRVLQNSHNTTLFLTLCDNYKTYWDQNRSIGCRITRGRRWCFHIDHISCLFLTRTWWTSDTTFAEGLDLRLARKSNYSAPKLLAVNPRIIQEADQILPKWQQNSNPQTWIDIVRSLNRGNRAINSHNADVEMSRYFEVASVCSSQGKINRDKLVSTFVQFRWAGAQNSWQNLTKSWYLVNKKCRKTLQFE